MRWVLYLALMGAVACGVAEAMGHNTRSAPCAHGDRRCINGTSVPKPATYALQIFWGGVDAGQVATGGAVTTKTGGAVTVARTTATQCQKSDGTWGFIASGAPCVEPNGLASRPSTSNYVTNTQTWENWNTDVGGGVITTGQACPDGTNSGVLVQDTSHVGDHRFYEGLGGNNPGAGDYSVSVLAKPWPTNPLNAMSLNFGGTGEAAVYDLAGGTVAIEGPLNKPVGFSTTNYAFNMLPAANGFFQLSFATSDPSSIGFLMVHVGHRYPEVTGGYGGDGGGILLCNPMVSFTKDNRPFVVNDGGGIGTRAADLISVTNPLDGGTPFVLGVSALVDNARWDTYRQRGLMQLGWDAGDSNTVSWFVTDAGLMTLSVVDNSGGVKSVTSNTALWPGRHYLRAVNNAGTMALFQDDAGLAVTSAGSGTGVITTQPPLVYLGSQGANSNVLGGLMQDICIDSSVTGCAYPGTKPPPYAPKTLVAFGDSLTYNGENFGTSYWPKMLHQDVPTWTTTNLGIGASGVTYAINSYADAGYYFAPFQYTSLEVGINDVGQFSGGADDDAALKFWMKWFWDTVAAGGSTPIIIRESPWALASGTWNASLQTSYDGLQTYVAAQAALFGYPYVDNYTSMRDGGASVSQPTLNCKYDYDTDGTGDVCGGATANKVHLNDAGQGWKESEIRSVLGI